MTGVQREGFGMSNPAPQIYFVQECSVNMGLPINLEKLGQRSNGQKSFQE
jgi:hypothetical protein